jgi:hypothetical protein
MGDFRAFVILTLSLSKGKDLLFRLSSESKSFA